jgi:hypothetical protein
VVRNKKASDIKHNQNFRDKGKKYLKSPLRLSILPARDFKSPPSKGLRPWETPPRFSGKFV